MGKKMPPRTAEHRKNLGESLKGRKLSTEAIRKRSESRKEFKQSAETKKKISDSLKGNIVSAETKAKIGEAMKGKKHSAETRKKLSESNKGKRRKITDAQLQEIMILTDQGMINRDIAEKYNVHIDTIGGYIRRERKRINAEITKNIISAWEKN